MQLPVAIPLVIWCLELRQITKKLMRWTIFFYSVATRKIYHYAFGNGLGETKATSYVQTADAIIRKITEIQEF